MPISQEVFVRAAAAIAAASVLSGRERVTTRELVTEAEKIIPWINKADVAAQLIGKLTVKFQDGTVEVTTAEGNHVSTSMSVDDQSVTISVNPEDDHGDATSDQITFSNDDPNSAVLNGTVSADGKSWTGSPVAEGTVNFTVSDPSAPDVAPFTAQVVVEAGPTSQLVGTVTVTPAASAPTS